VVEQGFLDYPDPDLIDRSVRLRRWALTDLECIELASHDKRIPAGTTVPAAYTPEGGRAFISRQWSRQTSGEGLSLAIADRATDEAVGLIVLMRRLSPATAEIGYWVIPGERRKGRATSAIGLLCRWAIESMGLVRLEARVMPANEPSLRALRRVGFITEGVLRRQYYSGGMHHDMVGLSLIADDLDRA
jgi:[ribosomal protein S5]-alanine N-acetyltransferase